MAPDTIGAMAPGLRISDDLTLPIDAVTETFAILAKRRVGKSNAAVVMAEEMVDQGLPWVAVDPKGDWWGIRAAGSSPGLPVVVFGGRHGDVPLEPGAGQLVADLIAKEHLTCVLDVSAMTRAAQRTFLTDFAERLYQQNTQPLHVFAEEADRYIPQMVRAADAPMVGAWEQLVKLGGFRGIGVTLITQRSASLNNDVLTQIETLIAMRTPAAADRKQILSWVEFHAAGAGAVAELPALENGEAWVISPQWLKTLTKITFRRRRTFDSGATPKVGVQSQRPTGLATVDLDRIKTVMAEVIERSEADDPAMLRRRIRELEKQLAHNRPTAKAEPVVEKVVERVEVPVLPAATLDRLESTVEALDRRYAELQGSLSAALEAATEARGQVTATQETLRTFRSRQSGPARPDHPRQAGPPVDRAPRAGSTPPPTPRPARSRTEPGRPSRDLDGQSLPPARQRLLDGLATLESIGIEAPTRPQVALWIGVSPKSSGFANNLGGLRSSGLIDYPSGSLVSLTDAGRARAAAPEQIVSDQELHSRIKALISPARWRLLQPLIDAYPDALDKDDLAQVAGVSASSSGFANNLGAMRTLGLVDYPRPRAVAASAAVFLHAG